MNRAPFFRFHCSRKHLPATRLLRSRPVTASPTIKMSPDSAVPRAVVVLLLLSFFCLYSLRFLPLPSGYNVSFPRIFPSLVDNDTVPVNNEHNLEMVLKDAAMKDRTVILTTLNEAWAAPNSIIDLFLASFRIGESTRKLLNHLVIIALDQKAYTRCTELHNHCFALVTDGNDFRKEANFMSPSYLRMMWRRIDFLRSVLEMGYNFVFTDADVMWFRDPFPQFYSDADFQIACDHFTGSSIGTENKPNGGFTYVKSNNRSIEFYKYWYSSQETYPRNHDQEVLNKIKDDTFIEDLGLKMRFLDTVFFGGLCEPSKDLNVVCTMHANCCIGLESKLHDLKIMLQDWKHFLSLPPSLKRSSIVSWSVPKNCSLDDMYRYESLEEGVQQGLQE